MSEQKALTPRIAYRDSVNTPYQHSGQTDERVVFNFPFTVRHAWVEIVDNIRAGDRANIEAPEPNNDDVIVVVRTTIAQGGGGKLRFRVWGTNF